MIKAFYGTGRRSSDAACKRSEGGNNCGCSCGIRNPAKSIGPWINDIPIEADYRRRYSEQNRHREDKNLRNGAVVMRGSSPRTVCGRSVHYESPRVCPAARPTGCLSTSWVGDASTVSVRSAAGVCGPRGTSLLNKNRMHSTRMNVPSSGDERNRNRGT